MTLDTARSPGSPPAGAVELLAATPVLGDLGRETLEHLASGCTRATVAGGEVLLRQGDAADAAYVVVRGRLRVERHSGGAVEARGELGPGDIVGELGLITRRGRSATIVAVRDTEVLRLGADAFEALVARHPEVLRELTAAIVDRLTLDDVAPVGRHPSARTVAVLAAGDTPPEVVWRLAHDLAVALGGERALGSAEVDAELGAGAADAPPGRPVETDLSAWLAALEAEHDGIVFRTDDRWTAWSERCVRQADHVLLVGAARRGRAVGEVERRATELAAARGIAVELVLVHPATSARPSGTASWLSDRAVAAHHQVRDGDASHVARLARRLDGSAVALVLGGGGPRGFAHLGVLAALEAAGVPVDAVGGTSIGSVMGVLPCLGLDAATAAAQAVDVFSSNRRLMGTTLPLVSMSSGRRLTELLRAPSFVGETVIEDLWLPFFCISANLTRVSTVVHDRGPAWQAIRASTSLPGVLPPLHHGGDLLVDGGVVDDLPVGVMRSRLTGRIVAVDLSPGGTAKVHAPFEASLSGWRVLANRIVPGLSPIDVPNVVEVLLRAKEVGGRMAHRERLEASPPDLHLHPPTDGVGALDFSAAPRLIEIGRRHAEEALAAGGAEQLLAPSARR